MSQQTEKRLLLAGTLPAVAAELRQLSPKKGEPALAAQGPPQLRRMKSSFEQTLIEVWRQALVENATVVELDGSRYPVRRRPKRGLRQVDFVFDGNEIRGLEQNPGARSEWAKLARSGKRGDAVPQRGAVACFVAAL
jgi:hypothetical protein